MNAVVAVVLASAALNPAAPAEDVAANVARGLDWLAKQQERDGSWSTGGQYPTALTAFAGTALLMEGSTLGEGKYAGHLRKAVAWFEGAAQPNGLLAANTPGEQGRVMLGHGYGLMFLSCVYAATEDANRRRPLEAVLKKAVEFAVKAQTTRGGWGYVAAADGSDFDEGHATVVVLQGLWAARQAGIPVPRAALDRGTRYFVQATNQEGGVVYSLASGAGGGGRPVVTAGAAATLPRGARPEQYAGWLNFAAQGLDLRLPGTTFEMLRHYYFARVALELGEEGHKKLAPALAEKDLVRWSAYRKGLFASLKKLQQDDGSWPDQTIGPIFQTSLALIILQVEGERVPFFSR